MRRIVILLVTLLSMAVSASAQLTIGDKAEGAQKLAVLQPEWAWLYRHDGHYFYVCRTDNRFDDWMWLDLGQTRDEAIGTLRSLRDTMAGCKRGETVRITSRGQAFTLVYGESLGARYFSVFGPRGTYAGSGPMNESALKKAQNYLAK